MNRFITYAIPLVLVLGCAVALPVHAADATTEATTSTATTVSKEDAAFIQAALNGGTTEIATSQLALKRGLTGSAREFAEQIVDDHGKLNDELKALAKAKGVALAPTPDAKAQKKIDALGQEKDQDLPAAYLDGQVDAHKHAVGAYKDASEDAKDPDVRAFAAKHVAALEHHLALAKELKKKI